MAVTIQRAVDGVPFLLETHPDTDLDSYARELVTLFDLATRRLQVAPGEIRASPNKEMSSCTP
jgi:hypothetical protein